MVWRLTFKVFKAIKIVSLPQQGHAQAFAAKRDALEFLISGDISFFPLWCRESERRTRDVSHCECYDREKRPWGQ